jgi:hypothetical protein
MKENIPGQKYFLFFSSFSFKKMNDIHPRKHMLERLSFAYKEALVPAEL